MTDGGIVQLMPRYLAKTRVKEHHAKRTLQHASSDLQMAWPTVASVISLPAPALVGPSHPRTPSSACANREGFNFNQASPKFNASLDGGPIKNTSMLFLTRVTSQGATKVLVPGRNFSGLQVGHDRLMIHIRLTVDLGFGWRS